jgi:hypothetical protein
MHAACLDRAEGDHSARATRGVTLLWRRAIESRESRVVAIREVVIHFALQTQLPWLPVPIPSGYLLGANHSSEALLLEDQAPASSTDRNAVWIEASKPALTDCTRRGPRSQTAFQRKPPSPRPHVAAAACTRLLADSGVRKHKPHHLDGRRLLFCVHALLVLLLHPLPHHNRMSGERTRHTFFSCSSALVCAAFSLRRPRMKIKQDRESSSKSTEQRVAASRQKDRYRCPTKEVIRSSQKRRTQGAQQQTSSTTTYSFLCWRALRSSSSRSARSCLSFSRALRRCSRCCKRMSRSTRVLMTMLPLGKVADRCCTTPSSSSKWPLLLSVRTSSAEHSWRTKSSFLCARRTIFLVRLMVGLLATACSFQVSRAHILTCDSAQTPFGNTCRFPCRIVPTRLISFTSALYPLKTLSYLLEAASIICMDL